MKVEYPIRSVSPHHIITRLIKMSESLVLKQHLRAGSCTYLKAIHMSIVLPGRLLIGTSPSSMPDLHAFLQETGWTPIILCIGPCKPKAALQRALDIRQSRCM